MSQNQLTLRPVNVHVPLEISGDLKKMQQVTASILKRLGCAECHSGHLLNFIELRDFIVNPKTLDIKELGGFGP
jgi:hypothetical protein